MNKTLYILWFQGFNNAPQITKKCVQSWKFYNPDWNIILIDNSNLKNYIQLENYVDIINNRLDKIGPTALSDVVRLILLSLYGGLWVDATTFCNKPLNDWLPDYINNGFFAFNKPGPDRLLSTWFIYSEKDNYITNIWLKSVVNYFKNHFKPHTYYWVHYLFGDLYKSDNTFKDMWDNVPKLSANGLGPQCLQHAGMFIKITDKFKIDIDSKITPLYKLTYKCDFPAYDETKYVYYLFSTIKPA